MIGVIIVGWVSCELAMMSSFNVKKFFDFTNNDKLPTHHDT